MDGIEEVREGSVEDVPRLIDRDVDIHKEVTVIRN